MDHRKEPRPLQCLTYGGLVRQRGRRVTVVDVEDLDRRVEGRVKQVLGQTHHVDLTRARWGEIEAHRLSRILSSEHSPTEGAQPATDLAPGTGQRRQASHCPYRCRATATALDADTHAERCWSGAGKSARERLDLGHW